MAFTLDKLDSLIALQVREDVHLEFKRSDIITKGKTNDLTKAVCAFANSDGGTLVIGVRDGKGGVAESFDDGVLPTDRGRERIEQALLLVRPAIQGIQITEFSKGSGIIYVLTIPRSRAAPHQAQDKCYYKRYGSISSPMEHFELEDIRGRAFNEREPLEIAVGLHGMLFHLALRNQSPFELSDVSVILHSNFDSLLLQRGLSNISLISMKPRTAAEYMIGSGHEIFQSDTPHLSAQYSYSYLGNETSGTEEIHIADYGNQAVIRTETEKHLEKISSSLEKIERQQRDLLRLAKEFRPLVNGTGLKLSASALRALGGDVSRKLEPFGMDADGFAETLSVDMATGRALERMFGHIGSAHTYKQAFTALPEEVQRRFKEFFVIGDD